MGELGTWLVRAREARGLTLEDAERDTRISRRYLQALETETFETIPAPVYARGFLRSYSQYLGLDPVEMLSLFPGEDDGAAPVIGRGGPSGNVGVATPPGQPQKPSMKTPISGQSAARPQWSKPSRSSKEPPMPKRPAARVPQEPLRPTTPSHGEYEIGGTMPAPPEPMIGVDIGVPVPARNLSNDPAAPRRNLTVIGVALAVIFGVVALALIISQMGGGASEDTPTPTSEASIGSTSESQTPTTSGTSEGSSAVTPGVVPAVEGLPISEARVLIAQAGFQIREIPEETQACSEKDTVVQQSLEPGEANPGSNLMIVTICPGP